jgi:hypothetical protein
MEYHLAQINIAKMIAPADSPVMAEFMNNLDHINELAEKSEGFIWRLKDDSNNATSIKVYDDEFIIINLSVWKSVEDLSAFVYQTLHADFLRKRKQWFERMKEQYLALWYVPAGERPTAMEAAGRLDHIRAHGETPYAFGFKKRFTAEEAITFQKNPGIGI